MTVAALDIKEEVVMPADSVVKRESGGCKCASEVKAEAVEGDLNTASRLLRHSACFSRQIERHRLFYRRCFSRDVFGFDKQ